MENEIKDNIFKNSDALNNVKPNQNLNERIFKAYIDHKQTQNSVWLKLAAILILSINVSAISLSVQSNHGATESSGQTELSAYFNLNTTTLYAETSK